VQKNAAALYDCHIHSDLSHDGTASMQEICDDLYKRGFSGLYFTDHMDLQRLAGSSLDYGLDFCAYRHSLRLARENWQNFIDICSGVEVGLVPGEAGTCRQEIALLQPDFIIGSLHFLDGQSVYEHNFSPDMTPEEEVIYYLENMLSLVREHNYFHVLGHLDMLLRHAPFDNRSMEKEEYYPLIDDILRTLIDSGRGIEVNTSGYRYGLNNPHPSWGIIRRYKELGGEIITCGSDGHYLRTIGQGIAEAYDTLRELGYQYISRFVAGKEIKIKL